MRTHIAAAAALAVLILSSCYTPSFALQCVPYARDNSEITLRGNAWTWWSSARGIYERGQVPRAGSVMVFKRYKTMRFGHVAVVRSVEHSRKLIIDHANWGSRLIGGRGKIATDIAVIDVSPENDWSQVRVWNNVAKNYGKPYPIYGFIYPNEESRSAEVNAAVFLSSTSEKESSGGAEESGLQTIAQTSDGPVSRVTGQRRIVRNSVGRTAQTARVTTQTAAKPVAAVAAKPVAVAAAKPVAVATAKPVAVAAAKPVAVAAAKPVAVAAVKPVAAAATKPVAAAATKPVAVAAAKPVAAVAAKPVAVATAKPVAPVLEQNNIDAELARQFGSGRYGAAK